MTGLFLLDWAIMAVSLFNTVILLWLGLTVLLNAERRNWGVWLAGGGLLLGGLFFISHSAILGRGLHTASLGMDFWWYVGWGPVIISPFAWYVVMLWYTGFWNETRSSLRRHRRFWFPLALLLAVALVVMLLFVCPLPSFWQVTVLDLSAVPSVMGVPILLLAYPFYILLCIVLSLDVLRHASSLQEVLKDMARRRARPWLVASTVLLLIVSLLVAWVMVWIVVNAQQRATAGIYSSMAVTLGWFDLIIASLIAVAVILLGQAIVAYEIFTGETLPRRGFFRHWRNAMILAAGYSAVAGGSLIIQLRPLYMLLLTTVLIVTFYALFGWRSFVERERYISHLRPFVSSQRLYESLLAQDLDVDVSALFQALCRDVLAVRRAHLVALGPLAPLIGSILSFPAKTAVSGHLLRSVADRFDSPRAMCVPLDPDRYEQLVWAVPLWSERGLVGALLLGEKQDGGLYTQEEIEIARASGERLIDTQATAQVSGRLMALLRQRIAQVKVMEGQGRRVLHDQILPQLHTAILHLSELESEPAAQQAVAALTSAHRQISTLMRDTASTAPQLLSRKGLIAALRVLVEGDFKDVFDQVSWQVAPDVVQTAERLPLYVNEVVYFAVQELVRNAARHGRGDDRERLLHLRIDLDLDGGLRLVIEDDGVGLSMASAATVGGRNGLRFHSTMLAAVGGSLEVKDAHGRGTQATIRFPVEVSA
ncbi:MAG: hypothetical protein JXA89_21815 [Anaerolineae bacterium]|nr:hypothetical protein [Anaerolineae bacterium]